MMQKKAILLVLIMAAIGAAANHATSRAGDLASQVAELKAELAEYKEALEKQAETIKRYQVENKKLTTEIARLKKRSGAAPAGGGDNYIVYEGKSYSRKWFVKKHLAYVDTIMIIEGEYFDRRKVYLPKLADYKVLSVIGNGEILVSRGINNILHISNAGSGWHDDDVMPDENVFIEDGSYKYVAVNSASKMVVSGRMFTPYRPTEAQFAEALRLGFVLDSVDFTVERRELKERKTSEKTDRAYRRKEDALNRPVRKRQPRGVHTTTYINQ